MPPFKKTPSLFDICVKSCLKLIYNACYNIECENPEIEFPENQDALVNLRDYLICTLPASLFDTLCDERRHLQINSDPRIQVALFKHPCLTVFKKCELDSSVPQYFWSDFLQSLTKLTVLNLKFMCTDEILSVVGQHCLLLLDINITSKADIKRSAFNASVLVRNVSDLGLKSISTLKQLRILSLDAPRSFKLIFKGIGRCITQAGIRKLVHLLPNLQEIKADSFNIVPTLMTKNSTYQLNLTKVKCLFASEEGISRLISVCPKLKDFSCTHLGEHGKDEIILLLANSNLPFENLELSCFKFNYEMEELLKCKGENLVHLSLWQIEVSNSQDFFTTIGTYCPNIETLKFSTGGDGLTTSNSKCKDKLFTKLTSLTIGCKSNLENILFFFFKCCNVLHNLTIRHQTMFHFDDIFLKLLNSNFLIGLKYLCLGSTVKITKEILWKIIEACKNLESFQLFFLEDATDVLEYIRKNNLDLKLCLELYEG